MTNYTNNFNFNSNPPSATSNNSNNFNSSNMRNYLNNNASSQPSTNSLQSTNNQQPTTNSIIQKSPKRIANNDSNLNNMNKLDKDKPSNQRTPTNHGKHLANALLFPALTEVLNRTRQFRLSLSYTFLDNY